MVEEPRHRVQVVGSGGKSAEDGKVKQDDGNQNGNDVKDIVVDAVARAATQVDGACSG